MTLNLVRSPTPLLRNNPRRTVRLPVSFLKITTVATPSMRLLTHLLRNCGIAMRFLTARVALRRGRGRAAVDRVIINEALLLWMLMMRRVRGRIGGCLRRRMEFLLKMRHPILHRAAKWLPLTFQAPSSLNNSL